MEQRSEQTAQYAANEVEAPNADRGANGASGRFGTTDASVVTNAPGTSDASEVSKAPGTSDAAGSAAAAGVVRIEPATVDDFHTVVGEHSRYWGERDLRSLHSMAMVQEFSSTGLVATADDGIRGYIFGFVTPDRVAYVHLIAIRDDARGDGLGRRLYEAFMDASRSQGAHRLKAITSVANDGSIAFHRCLGFDVRVVENYNGPGQTRVVFTRNIDEP